jgi:hypothetical protein
MATRVNMRNVIIDNILCLNKWKVVDDYWFRTEDKSLIQSVAGRMHETDFTICKGTVFHARKNFKISLPDYYYDRGEEALLLGDVARVSLKNVCQARVFVTQSEWVMFNLYFGNNVSVSMIFEP